MLAASYLALRGLVPAALVCGAVVIASAGPKPALTVALPLLVLYLLVGVRLAGLDRRAVALLGRPPVPDPHHHEHAGRVSRLAQLRARASEPATGRELLHALVNAVLVPVDLLLPAAGLLAVILLGGPLLARHGPFTAGPLTVGPGWQAWTAAATGLALLGAVGYGLTALAAAHAELARTLLGPRDPELGAQVNDLTRSRVRLVDAFDLERRRIERDLHDGAQQHLVALAMTLDLARIELSGSSHDEAIRLVERAHKLATGTLTELRELIAGVHPPVLTELGLPGAVSVLAERTPIPVRTLVDLPERLPQNVEAAAYFVLAEALANAGKHSFATSIDVHVRRSGTCLLLEVTDDGTGGAELTRGSGLAGLADRLGVLDGRLELSSPAGGPTTLRATVPLSAAARPWR